MAMACWIWWWGDTYNGTSTTSGAESANRNSALTAIRTSFNRLRRLCFTTKVTAALPKFLEKLICASKERDWVWRVPISNRMETVAVLLPKNPFRNFYIGIMGVGELSGWGLCLKWRSKGWGAHLRGCVVA